MRRVTIIIDLVGSTTTWLTKNAIRNWTEFFESESDPLDHTLMRRLFPGLLELGVDFPSAHGTWHGERWAASAADAHRDDELTRLVAAMVDAVRAPLVGVGGLAGPRDKWAGLADQLSLVKRPDLPVGNDMVDEGWAV